MRFERSEARIPMRSPDARAARHVPLRPSWQMIAPWVLMVDERATVTAHRDFLHIRYFAKDDF